MRIPPKDVVFIILLVLAGIVSAEVGISVISGIGELSPVKDYRAILITSVLFGLLIGCAIGLVLNIKSRRGGLIILGGLIALAHGYYSSLALKEFCLGLATGTILSLLSVFNVVEVNMSKVFRYILSALYLVFLYSTLHPLYPPVRVDPIMLQNNLIVLVIGSAGFFAVRRVV